MSVVSNLQASEKALKDYVDTIGTSGFYHTPLQLCLPQLLFIPVQALEDPGS